MRLALSLGMVAGVLVSATAALAAQPGFAFLEVPTGARATALGGAYSSLAGGVEAVYWNPARLTSSKGLEITGGHSELFQKLRHDYFAVGGHMFGGGIATSIRALYSEPIDERDDQGNLVGSFGSHDLELGLSYGHSIGSGMSVGGSAAIVRERISNLAAQTYSFGFGGAWEPAQVPGVRFSAAGQNLGPAGKYTIDGVEGQPVQLPAAFQSGVSYQRVVGARFHALGALEGRAVRGRDILGLMGAELGDASGAALRLGLRVNDTSTSVSFGAGYALPGFSFDYAFVPLRDDLGDTHRFGFNAHF